MYNFFISTSIFFNTTYKKHIHSPHMNGINKLTMYTFLEYPQHKIPKNMPERTHFLLYVCTNACNNSQNRIWKQPQTWISTRPDGKPNIAAS